MCHHVMGWRRVDDGVEMRGKVQEPSRRRLGQSDRDQESSNAGDGAAAGGGTSRGIGHARVMSRGMAASVRCVCRGDAAGFAHAWARSTLTHRAVRCRGHDGSRGRRYQETSRRPRITKKFPTRQLLLSSRDNTNDLSVRYVGEHRRAGHPPQRRGLRLRTRASPRSAVRVAAAAQQRNRLIFLAR